MEELDTSVIGLEVDVKERAPQRWWEVVLTRAQDGDMPTIEPGFCTGSGLLPVRSQGVDPHRLRPT